MSNRQSRLKGKAGWPSSSQQHDACMYPTHWHPPKKGANDGPRTGVRMMKRIGCNPYATCLVGVVSCVFERFVIFAFRENYLAFYIQKLG